MLEAVRRAGSLEEGARRRPATAWAWKYTQIARALPVGGRGKKLVETDLKRSAIEAGGDVAAEPGMRLVGTRHHGQRIPAVDRGDAASVDRTIARIGGCASTPMVLRIRRGVAVWKRPPARRRI